MKTARAIFISRCRKRLSSRMRLACLVFYLTVVMVINPWTTGGAAMDTARFSPCSASPNCVSSEAQEGKHFVAPLRYDGDRLAARRKMIDLLKSQKRVTITDMQADYIRAEFRSLVFRFVDIVEFYFPQEDRIVHVKSASQSGYYDFGVNRRRIEHLRKFFDKSVVQP